MRTYLVEGYLARTSTGEPATSADRARRIAAEFGGEGGPVEYVRAFFLRDDETCFHVFHSESLEALRRVIERAGLASPRVTEVLEWECEPPTPH